jgi:hypothetical protein
LWKGVDTEKIELRFLALIFLPWVWEKCSGDFWWAGIAVVPLVAGKIAKASKHEGSSAD